MNEMFSSGSLYTLFNSKEGIKKFYKLFYGVYKMNINNIYHHDIKPGNIVYHPVEGFKYIDYGLAFKVGSVEEKKMIERVKDIEYQYYSWDIKFLNQ